MYKKMIAVATLFMLVGMASADYSGSYQFDDIENATGDLTLRILVGITQKGTLIGTMQGIAIAVGTILVVIALIFALINKFRARGDKKAF